MTAQGNAPVIIKRKKVIAGGGHHGGAWKVAYADFVTAMMAFFLLMWLLGATNEKQRKGIADYFNPTIPVVKASGGGSGAFGGESVFSDNQNSKNGTGAAVVSPSEKKQASGSDSSGEAEGAVAGGGEAQREDDLEEVQKALMGVGGESMIEELLRRHVITRLTDEGLVIELFETADSKLFDEDNQPTQLLVTLLSKIVPVIRLVNNDIAVQAHTRSYPVVIRENPSWDRTTLRADRLRMALERENWPTERVRRMTGFADRMPLTDDPMDPRNDRVEIIVLRPQT